MIKPELGNLTVQGTPLSLTAGSVDATDVIDLQAINYAGITDVWAVISTAVAAGGDASDTYQFQWVVSLEETLDTNKELLSITVTSNADSRLATVGNHIMALNLGKMIRDIATSAYRYLGVICTLSSGATLSVNISVSNTEPPSLYHAQVCESNVGLPA